MNEAIHLTDLLKNNIIYIWFLLMAVWGGTASYLGQIKNNKSGFSVFEMVGEWTISGFAGFITAYICASANLDFFITSAAVGMSGHMGGRGLYMFEAYIKKRWEKWQDHARNDEP